MKKGAKFLLAMFLGMACVLFMGNFVKAGTWAEQTSGTTETLENVDFINSSTGWAVGGTPSTSPSPNSVVLKTTDGGANWITQSAGVSNDIGDVSFYDASHGWGVSSGSTQVIYTSNGGSSWSAKSVPSSSLLFGIKAVASSGAYVVGLDGSGNGMIWVTANAGTNWVAINPGFGAVVPIDIDCTDATNCVVVGTNGLIWKLVAGIPPTVTNVSPAVASGRDFKDVSCSGTYCVAGIGNAGGVAGGIFYSSDSGTTWTEQTTNIGSTEDVDGVKMIDQNNMWGVGSDTSDNSLPGPVLTTSDAGQTWVLGRESQSQCLLGVDFSDSNNGWMVGCAGKIFKYTGDTTAPVTTASPAGGIYKKEQTITLTSDDADSSTYYTTDGSTPTTLSAKYTEPFTIYTDTTLKFFSVDIEGNEEEVNTEEYTIRYKKIKLKKAMKNVLLYGKSRIDFKFSKLPKKPKKKYVKIKTYKKYDKGLNKNKSLKGYWKLINNLHKKKPKFKVRIRLHYKKKAFNVFKKQTKLKKKDLRVSYKTKKTAKIIKAKHKKKKRFFRFIVKKFPAKVVKYAIVRKDL